MTKAAKSTNYSAYRWTVRLDEVNGAEVVERAARKGGKPSTWCREAVFEKLDRERAADAAAAARKR